MTYHGAIGVLVITGIAKAVVLATYILHSSHICGIWALDIESLLTSLYNGGIQVKPECLIWRAIYTMVRVR